MAFSARLQRAGPASSNQGYPPALAAESLIPADLEAADAARFAGNTSARSHSKQPKIVWPERYHERYRLPANIEEQPF